MNEQEMIQRQKIEKREKTEQKIVRLNKIVDCFFLRPTLNKQLQN